MPTIQNYFIQKAYYQNVRFIRTQQHLSVTLVAAAKVIKVLLRRQLTLWDFGKVNRKHYFRLSDVSVTMDSSALKCIEIDSLWRWMDYVTLCRSM